MCVRAHADRHACEAGDITWALLRQDKDGTFVCQHLSNVCPFRFSKLNLGLPSTHWQAKLQKTVTPVTGGDILVIGTSGFWEEYRENSDTSSEALETQVLQDVNEFVREHKDVRKALDPLKKYWENKITNKTLNKVCVCVPFPLCLPICLPVCVHMLERRDRRDRRELSARYRCSGHPNYVAF